MKFYIKERHNPQFDSPYYVAMGKMSRKDALKYTKSAYGVNYMLSFNDEESYKSKIELLKNEGFKIHDN